MIETREVDYYAIYLELFALAMQGTKLTPEDFSTVEGKLCNAFATADSRGEWLKTRAEFKNHLAEYLA